MNLTTIKCNLTKTELNHYLDREDKVGYTYQLEKDSYLTIISVNYKTGEVEIKLENKEFIKSEMLMYSNYSITVEQLYSLINSNLKCYTPHEYSELVYNIRNEVN